MRFSQRAGIRPGKTLLQVDTVDTALRNRLWNVFQRLIWDTHRSSSANFGKMTRYSSLNGLIRVYWEDFFVNPSDQIPREIRDAIGEIRHYFFECAWDELYDLIEFTANNIEEHEHKFIELCNEALRKELSAYRFVESQITRITSEVEISAIEEALQHEQINFGASEHIRTAVKLVSDRKNPDYRNSIKESISAVESTVQKITGDSSASLGEALKRIQGTSAPHPALNKAFSSLYGYTSNADGIRHALLDEDSSVDFSDAMFMLVACSAFVTYLLDKSASQS